MRGFFGEIGKRQSLQVIVEEWSQEERDSLRGLNWWVDEGFSMSEEKAAGLGVWYWRGDMSGIGRS